MASVPLCKIGFFAHFGSEENKVTSFRKGPVFGSETVNT